MKFRSILKRGALLTGATTALVLATATGASAHHCYVPMYNLNGPASDSWTVYTLESAFAEFVGAPLCDAQVDAGYAAVTAAGLPVGIKIFERMTIGDGMQGKGKGDTTNPNGADGKGLEYFGAGSTLADDALGLFAETALASSCE
jgi:hypothetical protein